jgi:hypothetical protein
MAKIEFSAEEKAIFPRIPGKNIIKNGTKNGGK